MKFLVHNFDNSSNLQKISLVLAACGFEVGNTNNNVTQSEVEGFSPDVVIHNIPNIKRYGL